MPSLSQPKEDVYCTVGAQIFFTDYTLILSQLLLNDAYLPGKVRELQLTASPNPAQEHSLLQVYLRRIEPQRD